MKAEYQFLPLHQHFLTQQEAAVVFHLLFFFPFLYYFFFFASPQLKCTSGETRLPPTSLPPASPAQNAFRIFCLWRCRDCTNKRSNKDEQRRDGGRCRIPPRPPRPSLSVTFLLFSMTSPWSRAGGGESSSKYTHTRTQLSSHRGKEAFPPPPEKKSEILGS